MNFLFILLVALTSSYLLSVLLSKLKISKVISQMIIGFVLGVPMIKDLLFDSASIDVFSGLANLGVIFLLYYIGLEMDFKALMKLSKSAMTVSVFSAVLPFIMGFVFSLYYGFNIVQAIVVSAALAVTAEAVSAAILGEYKLINTTIGRLILGAGMFDDLFEVILLVFVSSIVGTAASQSVLTSLTEIFIDLAIFAIVVYVVMKHVLAVFLKLAGEKISSEDLLTVSFIITLFMSVLSQYLQFGTIVGALIAGMVTKDNLKKKKFHDKDTYKNITSLIDIFTFGFLAPIFFIWVGVSTDVGLILVNPWLGIFLTIIATVGKILGAMLAQLVTKRSLFEGYVVGIGMNARGVISIVAAEMARNNGLIGMDIYSAIVFMSFATTLISPLLLKSTITKLYKNGVPE